MQFNSHALHTDHEVIRGYFDGISPELIYKLYLFYEADYEAFGYEPPWSWLNISAYQPSMMLPISKPYTDLMALSLELARADVPKSYPHTNYGSLHKINHIISLNQSKVVQHSLPKQFFLSDNFTRFNPYRRVDDNSQS